MFSVGPFRQAPEIEPFLLFFLVGKYLLNRTP